MENQTFDHSATFSPQDNKLRLYFAYRLPRPEWDALRAMGFVWCMKQSENGGCDMAAHWTPEREDKCLEMCGEVGDEDQPREERAADRAERFEGYRENRVADACGLADRYDGAPKVFGNQDSARAERQAARVDRLAGKAVNNWEKAEYWQRRTAGVVSHAKYLERPEVRFRRMKGYESELRKLEASYVPSQVLEGVEFVRQYRGEEYVAKGHDCVGMFGMGRGKYARSFTKAEGLELSARGQRWANHYRLLLAYERQMLDAQGGAGVTEVEVVAGGFYGSRQVQKVSKDRSGRVSKVYLWCPHPWKTDGSQMLRGLDAEDMKLGAYRAPTAEEAAAFKAEQKARAAKKPKAPPLLTLSQEDAERLQKAWNEEAASDHHKRMDGRYTYKGYAETVEAECQKFLAVQVLPMTQASYSERSGGTYSPYKTVDVAADWTVVEYTYGNRDSRKPVAFRVRVANTSTCYAADRVVVLTDKKANPLPALVAVVAPVAAKVEAVTA